MDVTEALRRKAERWLRSCRERAERAQEVFDETAAELDGLKSGEPSAGRQRNAVSDPTQRAALRLEEARRRLEYCRAWVHLQEQLYVLLPDGFTGTVFASVYLDGMTDMDVARRNGRSRQAVRRERDRICQAAVILAVQKGLLRVRTEKAPAR